MQYCSADDFYVTLAEHLAKAVYSETYMNEAAFEVDVWNHVREFMSEVKGASCLTSHTNREGRSGEDWKAFCREERGPDVKVLGSSSRLDIVIKHPVEGRSESK